jgi:dipeptidyl aminopeptidase/acylaminoacyl peptidase
MAIKDGHSVLYLIHTKNGTLEPISNAYSEVSQVRHVSSGSVVFSAGKNNEPASIVLLDFSTNYKATFVTIMSTANAASKGISPDMLSPPQPMTLLVPPNEEPLYVNYYPPTNPGYVGPSDERPPCVVGVHGGPTSNATQSLNWTTQFFTSRGFAWYVVCLHIASICLMVVLLGSVRGAFAI